MFISIGFALLVYKITKRIIIGLPVIYMSMYLFAASIGYLSLSAIGSENSGIPEERLVSFVLTASILQALIFGTFMALIYLGLIWRRKRRERVNPKAFD